MSPAPTSLNIRKKLYTEKESGKKEEEKNIEKERTRKSEIYRERQTMRYRARDIETETYMHNR